MYHITCSYVYTHIMHTACTNNTQHYLKYNTPKPHNISSAYNLHQLRTHNITITKSVSNKRRECGLAHFDVRFRFNWYQNAQSPLVQPAGLTYICKRWQRERETCLLPLSRLWRLCTWVQLAGFHLQIKLHLVTWPTCEHMTGGMFDCSRAQYTPLYTYITTQQWINAKQS
jgi:hypothetical protein